MTTTMDELHFIILHTLFDRLREYDLTGEHTELVSAQERFYSGMSTFVDLERAIGTAWMVVRSHERDLYQQSTEVAR